VESTEYVEGYDAALSQIDDIARIATEQGRMLERAREQKACRALAKASLTDSYWNSTDNEAVFLGSDGTTDYGLASNRTQTLDSITSESLLLASDGNEMRKAISKVAEIMFDIGINPAFNEARCVLIPKHWNWFHHSDAGIQTYDRDVNGVNLRSYANMMDTEFSIDGIRLTQAPFMARAILQSVTYGWSSSGLNGFERDAATKYVNDNSKLVAVVYLPSAVYGAQVLGPQVDSYFDRSRRAQALWAGSDIAFKGIRTEYAFPIILDS
jgi:hypothetical protein